MKTRRDFLCNTAVLATAAAGAAPSLLQSQNAERMWHFTTFTKPFQHLSYEEMAEVIAELGFQGIEAPIRPGGHVLPERIEEDLPKLVAALKKHNLEVTIAASGINAINDEQRTEVVLKTLAAHDIGRFRMSYYRYDLDKPIYAQLNEFRPQLRDLIALSKEIGIKPIYQNHSGAKYCGTAIWDLFDLFKEHDPKHIGVAFDIGHATVEGSKAWRLNYGVIEDYVDTIYCKEPAFVENKIEFGPLGQGAVDKAFYELVAARHTGPINLHVEYLGHKDPAVVPKVIEATRRDFATLKKLLAQ